jgi:hypothetical protein
MQVDRIFILSVIFLTLQCQCQILCRDNLEGIQAFQNHASESFLKEFIDSEPVCRGQNNCNEAILEIFLAQKINFDVVCERLQEQFSGYDFAFKLRSDLLIQSLLGPCDPHCVSKVIAWRIYYNPLPDEIKEILRGKLETSFRLKYPDVHVNLIRNLVNMFANNALPPAEVCQYADRILKP